MGLWIFGVTLCLVTVGLPSVLLGATVHRAGHHGHHSNNGTTPGHSDGTINQTTSPTNVSKAVAALPQALRIASFNIKTFGKAKMSDPFKAGIIRDIVMRYDVILIQEIRDSSGESLQQLWDMVDRTVYGLVFSERLGRSSYKEQYAYFYNGVPPSFIRIGLYGKSNQLQLPLSSLVEEFKTAKTRLVLTLGDYPDEFIRDAGIVTCTSRKWKSRLTLVASHQYDDGLDDYTDDFEREPFSVRLRPIGGSWDLALIGVHIKPGDAVKEIGHLLQVYYDVRNTWSDVQNFIIMGDMNADCSYVSKSSLDPLPIYNQTELFHWPIGFDADTTTSSHTDCAYDRFILSGTELNAAYIPQTAGIYRFENAHGLSYGQMCDVSDHYPIELELS